MAAVDGTLERSSVVDPRTGFCRESGIYHSIRPHVPLPCESIPLSYTAYAFSLLHYPLTDRPAFVDAAAASSCSISYSDLASRVGSLASALVRELGVSKGDVAFILSPSRLEIPVLSLALFSVGAVVAAANPLSTTAELAYQIGLVSPSIFFATSDAVGNLPREMLGTFQYNVLLIDSPPFLSMMISRSGEDQDSSNNTNVKDLVEIRQSDVAAIHFSSGTTGRVKAAAVPHRSFISQVAGFHFHKKETEFETTLLTAPMFHTWGFFMSLKAVALGETTVVAGRLTTEEMVEVAIRHEVTQVTAAPPVVVALSRSDAADRLRLSALDRVICGGAPLPEESARRFTARLPRVAITQALGSTECGGIARMIGHDECRVFRSVGRLTDNVEAMVVDVADDGRALPPGKIGELWIRGPATMLGYVCNPEANTAAFSRDGWVKTGDLCYFDHDGFLFVVERLKEMIKYKGYQVAPAELERLLYSHPDVEDAAVIPYPHELAGEIPMACVVVKSASNVTERELMEYVSKQVAPYKKIRKVVFVESIPKSSSGKMLRRELVARRQALAASSRL